MAGYEDVTPHASFGSIPFDVRGEGGGATQFDDFTNYVAEDLNFGSITYVQILGRKSGPFTLGIIITPANLNSLRGMRTQQATLKLPGGETRSAILMDIQGARAYTTNGQYAEASVTFYV